MSYTYEYRQDDLFGGDLLGKVHCGIHRFFDSCAMGVKEDLDTTYLDFSDLMREIERRRYHCKPPAWISKLIKSKDKKIPGEKKRRSPGQEGNRDLRIFNGGMSNSCKLADDESYRFMFNPASLKDLQRPKKNNGELVYLRYHTIGHCFKDCKFANGHGTLLEEERGRLVKFIGGVRESKKKFGGKQTRFHPRKTILGGDTKDTGETKQG